MQADSRLYIARLYLLFGVGAGVEPLAGSTAPTPPLNQNLSPNSRLFIGEESIDCNSGWTV